MAFIFISHSSVDKPEWATPLYERLKSDGHEVFLDEPSILPGESIPDKIAQALERIRTENDAFFVPLLSSSADNSAWVKRECAVAEYFLSQKTYPYIIPVVLPSPPHDVHRYLPFPDRKYLKATNVSQLIKQLNKTISRIKDEYFCSPDAVLDLTIPYMSISKRQLLVKDLFTELLDWHACPADIKGWIESVSEYRLMSTLEHLQSRVDDIVPFLAQMVESLRQRAGKPISVFVSGFPALGKSTLSKTIAYRLSPKKCSLVHIESYLKNRSYRQKVGIQGDDRSAYDIERIDRDLENLLLERASIQYPTKALGDTTGFELNVPARDITIVDGALNFIYELHLKPDLVLFIDAGPLQKLALSVLRDMGRLPGDRNYSLPTAVAKFNHYLQDYYKDLVYLKPWSSISLLADIHHRYTVHIVKDFKYNG